MARTTSRAIRSLVAVLLLAGCTPAGERPAPGAEADAARSAREPAPAAIPGSIADTGSSTPPATPRPPEPEPEFYRYTDDEGRVHFVSSRGDIPPRYQGEAKRMQVTADRLQRDASLDRRVARPPTRMPGRVEPVARRSYADVIVYTAPWCGWCRRTLAWLDEHDVDYENRDIDADPRYKQELRDKTGSTAVPLVEIGDELIRGYSAERMAAALAE